MLQGQLYAHHGMGDIIYLAYMVSPLVLLSPLFYGYDRGPILFRATRYGIMHILSGIFVICAPCWVQHHRPCFCSSFCFICFATCLRWACAATAFHLVDDKEKEFPIIRLFVRLVGLARYHR